MNTNHHLPVEMLLSPSLERFKSRVEVAFGDVGKWWPWQCSGTVRLDGLKVLFQHLQLHDSKYSNFQPSSLKIPSPKYNYIIFFQYFCCCFFVGFFLVFFGFFFLSHKMATLHEFSYYKFIWYSWK